METMTLSIVSLIIALIGLVLSGGAFFYRWKALSVAEHAQRAQSLAELEKWRRHMIASILAGEAYELQAEELRRTLRIIRERDVFTFEEIERHENRMFEHLNTFVMKQLDRSSVVEQSADNR